MRYIGKKPVCTIRVTGRHYFIFSGGAVFYLAAVSAAPQEGIRRADMLRLQNITAGYAGKEILHNIGLTFEEGKITSVIGKNGCGKTTLLKAAARLLPPMQGKVFFKERDIYDMPVKQFARCVSLLPQARSVPAITVQSFVMHGRFPYLGFPRIPSEKDKTAVEEAMKSTGTLNFANTFLSNLSGGQRQKVYFAMLLAQDTPVVLLDEPTTYLDIGPQLEMLELIQRLKQAGKTVIMVLHDLNHAMCYSDNLCILQQGSIFFHGTPEQAYQDQKLQQAFGIPCKKVEQDTGKGQYIFG